MRSSERWRWHVGGSRCWRRRLLVSIAVSSTALLTPAAPLTWLSGWQTQQFRDRRPLVALWADRGQSDPTLLPVQPSETFIEAVEAYFPGHPDDGKFEDGPPPRGFRSLVESILPYHPNPEWMVWPEVGSFERDQKVASVYNLATGLYTNINKGLREDDEDGMRRHAGFIWELRQLLRFRKSTICTPEGRKCKPFQGQLLRGLQIRNESLESEVEKYKVGTEFVWPGFTSCQLADGEEGLWPFNGNLNFRIDCNIDPRDMDVEEMYAPVRIGRFLTGSNEVLLPPYTKFRVVGDDARTEPFQSRARGQQEIPMKHLEVIELPAVATTA